MNFKKLLLLILIFVLIGCDKFPVQLLKFTKANFVENSIEPAEIDKKIPTVLNVPPQDMRKALADSYRLPLDRRFVWSIPTIHHFITGESVEEIQTQFNNGKWEISYKGKMVAQVPDLPGFADVIEPVILWATNLAKEKSFKLKTDSKLPDEMTDINQSIDAFFAPSLLRASKKLNSIWKDGNRHPEILKSSSRALVYLSLQSYDKLSLADHLLAKTFATVVLTRALTKLPMDQEESLLAEIMGYNAHAMQKAKTLRINNPVRLYVNQSNKNLVTLAEKNNKNLLLKFLVLNRFAEKKDLQQWTKWMQTQYGNNHISLAILGTGLRLNSFRGNGSYPRLIQGTINFELQYEDNEKSFTDQLIPTIDKILSNSNIYSLLKALLSQNPDFDKLLDEFEKNVNSNGKQYQGPFLTSKDYKSFYESYYYTSLYKEGLFHLDNRGSIPDAKLFLAQLKGKSFPHQIWIKAKSTIQSLKNIIDIKIASSKSLVENPINLKPSGNLISKEFIRWYDHIVDAAQGKGDIDDLAEDLISFQHLGDAALFRTYRTLASTLHMGNAGQYTAVKRLVRAMDSRVNQRIQLAKYSQERLLDLKMMDRLYQSAFSINPNIDYYQQSRHAFFAGDIKKLKTMVNNPNVPALYRGRIVYHLGKLNGFSSKEQLQAFQSLVRDQPEKFMLISVFVDFLFKEENYALAKTVIQDWINEKHIVGGLENLAAWNKLAEAYYLEGDYEMAWEKISNALQGYMGETIKQAGNILEKLGKIEEADKAFSAAIIRYPSSINAIADYSGFLWRNGKYEKAAQLIADKKRYITNKEWVLKIGETFAEAFQEKTPEGFSAFTLLSGTANDSEGMSEMAKTVFINGNAELAFKMESSLKFGGNGLQQGMHQVQAFKYLREFTPKKEAMRWLKMVLHPGLLNHSAAFLFSQKDYEYLWSFVRSPNTFGWTLRAAAMLKYDEVSDRDKRRLHQYYALPGMNEIDQHMGKYLLSLISEEQLLSFADNDRNRCMVAYFIGFKAEAEGRYDDASDWYRVSVESGGPKIPEYHWAFARLFVWKSHFKKLSVLAKEGI